MADNVFQRFGNRLLSPGNLSDENVRRNREMSRQLLRQVSTPRNIQHPTQGLALLANALNAQIFRQRAGRGEKALKEQRATQMGELLGNLNLGPEQQKLFESLPENAQQQIAVQAAGRQLLPAGDSPFTLSPGQTRFGPSGQEVASLPSNTGTDDQRERSINDSINLFGLSRGEAVKLEDGLLRIEPDPSSGKVRIIDMVDQTVREARIQPAAAQQPQQQPQQTLFDLAGTATGLIPSATAAVSQVSGVLGGPISEPTVQARQSFKTATNDFIRALSVNPRFPVAEIKRIREEINLSPSVFDSGPLMQNRMIAIDRVLRQRLSNEQVAAADPNTPETTRNAAASSARDITNFLNVMGVPQGAPKLNSEQIKTLEDLSPLQRTRYEQLSPQQKADFWN